MSIIPVTLAGLLVLAADPLTPGLPPTPRRPVTDTYHEVKIVDDYRWLEDWNDPSVKAWSEAQNTVTRAHLAALPHAGEIRARVEQIMTAPSIRHSDVRVAGKRLLAMRRDSSRQQPMLVVFDDAAAVLAAAGGKAVEPRTLLDPAAEQGASIDWFVPSPDGELVAISVSLAGTESGDVRIVRAADGSRVGEVVPRVNGGTAGGSLAWAADGTGFYYSRYPRAGERPEADLAFYTQVYYHKLGTDSKDDRYETGKDFPKIAEILLESSPNDGTVLARVQDGDGGEFIHLIRDPKSGTWTQLDGFKDRNVQAALGPDHAVYIISRKDAPRGKLLRLPLPTDGSAPKIANAAVIIPEAADTLVSEFADASNLCITDTMIYAVYQLGGPSEVRAFGHDGKPAAKPGQPPVSAAGGLTRAAASGDRVMFNITSFVQPPTWIAWSPDDAAATPRPIAALSTKSSVDFSAYEVVREMATSKDGTKVPVNIACRRGQVNEGKSPCLVTAYGGFAISIEPRFDPADIVLLEQGFVLATANIRGGGEFGEAWHRGGSRLNKQNCFDDFAAACQHMVERRYTSADRMAIKGGSNGGLLMGATLTQHPDICKAVVSSVGIYDMLRVELSSNGAFNIPEFGTVKDRSEFEALRAYSPYHRVTDGVAYPAVLFLTGANDPRVDPMQSRKMVARLQAATGSGAVAGSGAAPRPILLRTSSDTGHGGGTPLKERIAQAADVDAFLMNQLGVDYHPTAN